MSEGAATLELLARKIRLVSATGEAIQLRSVSDPQKLKGNLDSPPKPSGVTKGGYYGLLAPIADLVDNGSYSLEATSDGDAVIGFSDDSDAEKRSEIAATGVSPVVLSIPVHTGSAPRMVALEYSSSKEKPLRSVRIKFSEPIQLGTLASGLIITGASGKLLAGCVLSSTTSSCIRKESEDIMDQVDFQFSASKTDPQELRDGKVLIGDSVVGSLSTIGKSAKALGIASVDSLIGSAVEYPLRSGNWQQCGSEAAIQCMRAP